MATWAASNIQQTVFGNERVVYATLTASGSYTSGGDTVNASIFGLDYVDFVDMSPALPSSTTGFVTANPTTLPATSFKIQLFGGAASGVALAEPSGSIAGTTLSIEVRGV